MAYVNGNPKSAADLRRRVAAGEQLTVFQPGGLFPLRPDANGRVFLEGPHYPKPHKWYAQAVVDENHVITKVLK